MTSGRYILQGHEPVPCENLMKWGEWMKGERHVSLDTLGDVKISTVFLGLDHAFGSGPPVLFETMVFGGPLDGEQDRYCTWEEAEAGHQAMVEKVKTAT